MAWASSSTTSLPARRPAATPAAGACRRWSPPRRRREAACAGVVGHAVELVLGRLGGMDELDAQRRREPGASPPSSWPAARPAGPAARAWPVLRSSAPTTAPRPGSSCPAPCRRPGRRPAPGSRGTTASRRPSPGTCARSPCSPVPGLTRWRLSGLRIFASTSPSHLPAWTKDHSRSSSPPASSSARSAGAPANSRIPSTNESPSRGLLLHVLPVLQRLLELLAVDFDPLAAQQHQAVFGGHQLAPFGLGEFLVAQGPLDLEVEHPVGVELPLLLARRW